MQYFTKRTFDLISELKKNNNREWYNENKGFLNEFARMPFEDLLIDLSLKLKDTELPLKGSKKTMFRQFRDIRFSKNKIPFKTNISGVLSRNGVKNGQDGVLYIHIEESRGYIAAGFHNLDPENLHAIRERIVDIPEAFELVLNDLKKNKLFLEENNCLKRLPRDFSEFKEHKFFKYLKFKSFITIKPLEQSELMSNDLDKIIIKFHESNIKLLKFGFSEKII